MPQSPTFVLGVNYWPRKKAMYWWKDFERSEVEAEFTEMAALGLDVVRIFLFWEDFQPAPDQVNQRALDDLGTVLDVATEAHIRVMPTFFTGHMSGINWWPGWALLDEEDPNGHLRIVQGEYTTRVGRDPYADPFMLEAERVLLSAVCERFGAHPGVYSWNLSNEPDIFARPRSYEDSAAWNATHASTIRRYSPRPVSAGMHLPTIAANNGFRPDYLAPHNDFLSMHAYSIYFGPTQDDDPLNSDVVPLAALVTEGLGGKAVLLEEFGYASSEHGDVSEYKSVRRGDRDGLQYFADDQSGGRYYREVLEKLARCGSLGAFAWMFSDYAPTLWDRPPFDTHEHERFFGLTRHDGSVKPSGEAMRDFAQRVARGESPVRSVSPLQLDPDEWYGDPVANFTRTFDQWRGQV